MQCFISVVSMKLLFSYIGSHCREYYINIPNIYNLVGCLCGFVVYLGLSLIMTIIHSYVGMTCMFCSYVQLH